VGEASCRPGLTDESLGELFVRGQTRIHDLDGYRSVEPGIRGLVHGRHSAARDTGADAIAPVQQPPNQRVGGGHIHPESLEAEQGTARVEASDADIAVSSTDQPVVPREPQVCHHVDAVITTV
jgi:hypothetical protein